MFRVKKTDNCRYNLQSNYKCFIFFLSFFFRNAALNLKMLLVSHITGNKGRLFGIVDTSEDFNYIFLSFAISGNVSIFLSI